MIDSEYPDFSNTPACLKRPPFGYRLKDRHAKPYISIVTPFYNAGFIFHETVHTVLQQSFQQWEWIIIDDGSTDPKSVKILHSYRDQDPRIQVYTQSKNIGNSTARNIGVRHATTPYVVLLDTDDLLEPTAIEKWWWFLESHPEYGFVKGYSVGFGAYQYVWTKGFHHERTFLEENLATMASMVRKNVYQAVDGFDESRGKKGLNDWEFWLRCANAGYWGGVVPEFLDWYRRRVDHTDRWPAWTKEGKDNFLSEMRVRYPRLWEGGFPEIQSQITHTPQAISYELPCDNHLQKTKPRILLITSWLETDQENKFLIPMINGLLDKGWEVTVTAIQKGKHNGLHDFSQSTPDIFILPNFLAPQDYPRFLEYLVRSRQIEAVLVSNCEIGKQFLPYLRSQFPKISCSEFIPGAEYWLNGNSLRINRPLGSFLDRIIVPSKTMKSFLVQQGIDREKIHVLSHVIEMNPALPDLQQRDLIRANMGIGSEVPIILYAAHLDTKGRPILFANTILQLQKQGIQFVALAIGDGPNLEWLHTFSNMHGLDVNGKMRILGAVPTKRFHQLMTAADIFFQPSLLPGTELSMYQAMAYGLTVVGAKLEEERPRMTQDSIFLIQPGSEEVETEQYASTLAKRLQRHPQPKDKMEAEQDKFKAHFSLENIGEELHTLLQEAINQQPPELPPEITKKTGKDYAFRAVEFLRLSHWSETLIENQRTIIKNQEDENARLEAHRALWEGVAAERDAIIKKQEQDKTHLEEHRALWEGIATERETIIKKQEQDKTHLEEHRVLWEGIAAEREAIIKKQEGEKKFLEQERAYWEELANERQSTLEILYEKFWFRWGRHVDLFLHDTFKKTR